MIPNYYNHSFLMSYLYEANESIYENMIKSILMLKEIKTSKKPARIINAGIVKTRVDKLTARIELVITVENNNSLHNIININGICFVLSLCGCKYVHNITKDKFPLYKNGILIPEKILEIDDSIKKIMNNFVDGKDKFICDCLISASNKKPYNEESYKNKDFKNLFLTDDAINYLNDKIITFKQKYKRTAQLFKVTKFDKHYMRIFYTPLSKEDAIINILSSEIPDVDSKSFKFVYFKNYALTFINDKGDYLQLDDHQNDFMKKMAMQEYYGFNNLEDAIFKATLSASTATKIVEEKLLDQYSKFLK